jgi:hypothetical protein
LTEKCYGVIVSAKLYIRILIVSFKATYSEQRHSWLRSEERQLLMRSFSVGLVPD